MARREAARVHTVHEQDHEHAALRIDPDGGAGEAGVAEATRGEVAAGARDIRRRVPSERAARVRQLGSLAPEARTLRDVALPFLHDLLDVTHEVAHLVVRDGDKALYLERLMARPEVHVRSRVASRLPLHATGPGKILLAHAPDDVVEQVLAGPLPRLARNTSPTRTCCATRSPASASPATASPARR